MTDQELNEVELIAIGPNPDCEVFVYFKNTKQRMPLNEAVARKLGWGRCAEDSFYPEWWIDPKTNLFSREPSDYCHSIEAAWEIVEHITTIGLKMNPLEPKGDRWFWRVHLTLTNSEAYCHISRNLSPDDPADRGPRETADTAPMAICLAFLKLTSQSIP